MAEGGTPELRIRGVIDLSGVRQDLASLQGQASRGIAVGGTFAGESPRGSTSLSSAGAGAGIAGPLAPIGGIAPNVYQSPAIAGPVASGTPAESVGATVSDASAASAGGGGFGIRIPGVGLAAYAALRGLRAYANADRQMDEQRFRAAGALSRADYFRAQAGQNAAADRAFFGIYGEIRNWIDPNTSFRGNEEQFEAMARGAELNERSYGLALRSGNERAVRQAGDTGASPHERNLNRRLTQIRVEGESEQAKLRFEAHQIYANVNQMRVSGPLTDAQQIQIGDSQRYANTLLNRAGAIGEDTVEQVKRARADEKFAQTMQAQGLTTDLAAGRLRMQGHTGLAGIVAAYGRGVQMIGEASRTGDADVQRLTAESAGLGVQEAIGGVVRQGAAGIAQWVRQRTAEGTAARRDVFHTAELQAQQNVAELQANRQPVAAGIAGILADTKLAVQALKTDDPEYTKQRDALRGIGVARLRAFQNNLADASQAVEVAPGSIAPGAGQGRVGAGAERDTGKQIADAVKEAMGAGGNATGDASGNLFQKLGRVADGLERFLSVVTGG